MNDASFYYIHGVIYSLNLGGLHHKCEKIEYHFAIIESTLTRREYNKMERNEKNNLKYSFILLFRNFNRGNEKSFLLFRSLNGRKWNEMGTREYSLLWDTIGL